MKPAPVAYRRPTSLDDALAALAEPGAKVLAGGQSLVPLLSMRLANPALLVDVNALPGLDHVTSDAVGVRVGALARHADVLADAGARAAQPLLAAALGYVAHGTVRNRGTVVGSLAHADPAAELPAVLAVLGGSVDVASVRGRRTVPAGALYAGPMEATLEADELVLEATFPALRPGEGVAFEEVSRRHGDYAVCGVAALVRCEGERVVTARAGYLSVADVPTVVDLAGALDGGSDDAALGRAGEAALARLDPQPDVHASAAYRAQLVRVLTARALRAALAHAGGLAGARTGGRAGGRAGGEGEPDG